MQSQLLKNTLRLNALVTTLFVTAILFFKEPMADIMGSFNAVLLSYIAYALIGFVLLVLLTSEQKQLNIKLATLIAYLDGAWVLGSLLLIVFASSWLSMTGIFVIVIIAIAVALFAYYEVKGIKQLESQA